MKKVILLFVVLSTVFNFSQPLPPDSLTAEEIVVGGQKQIYLDWHYPQDSIPIVYFDIYRKNGAINDTGTYVKRNINPYYQQTHFWDNYITNGSTYTFYVVARKNNIQSQPSNLVEITISSLPLTGVVQGVITSDSGGLLNQANVYLHPLGANFQYFTNTNSQGFYSFNVNPGTYFLQAGKPNYLTEFFDNVPTLQQAQPIIFNVGDTIEINLGLAPEPPVPVYTVSGSIKDSLNNPIEGYVKIYRVLYNSYYIPDQIINTDSSGNFSADYESGNIIIFYASEGTNNFYPEFFNNKSSPMDADKITVSGNADTINFILSERPAQTAAIQGSVRNQSGESVQSIITTWLKTPNGFYQGPSTTTDSSGNYSAANLQPGKYILLASPAQNYQATFFRYDHQITLNWLEGDSVVVENNQTIQNIDFVLVPLNMNGSVSVTGVIKDNSGIPVAGAFAFIIGSQNELITYAVSDQNGYYSVSGLTSGTYTAAPGKINYSLLNDTLLVINQSSGTFNNVDLTLIPHFPPVPVELISFTAEALNGEVIIRWATASELNNKGFVLLRSSGSDYEEIIFVNGKGTSTEVSEYITHDKNIQPGEYKYLLRQYDTNGSYADIQKISVIVNYSYSYQLEQNYPNPFNPTTTIRYEIADKGNVNIKVYDMLGSEVAVLVNEEKNAGSYEILFNASKLASGTYFYRIISGDFNSVRKFTIIK